jgi:hypothetical protein
MAIIAGEHKKSNDAIGSDINNQDEVLSLSLIDIRESINFIIRSVECGICLMYNLHVTK